MSTPPLPLAVDLDGTLVHGDVFGRAMAVHCRRAPWNALSLLWWLRRGRAYAKAHLNALYPVDAATLPYDARVLTWLRAEKARGRVLALATASDESVARAVAAHLGLFDAVFASDGRTNLKAHRKAAALTAAYPAGFVYAGNEHADLLVWRAARAAVVANAPPALERLTRRLFAVERVFSRDG